MKWDKYTIAATTASEDIISAMLSEIGIEGIEIENNVPLTDEETGSMFIDFPLELPPDHGESRISFYLEAGEDHTEILNQVRAALEQQRQFLDIGSGEITQCQTEDLDWMNNWKQFFSSFTIGNILIKPTWEQLEDRDADKILIEIDPGSSFGTGKHETTQLCIRQLEKYIEKARFGGCEPKVLDIGCGSGILSITALKLGASEVTGIDIDENCITCARENMQVNHLENARAQFFAGNLAEDEQFRRRTGIEKYDIAAANILADIIIPMAPAAAACLKPGGIFITSGIIDFKEQETAEALTAAGFELLETNVQGEWVNITAQKKKVI